MTILFLVLYALAFLSSVLTISAYAARGVHVWARRCVDWLAFILVCEANGLEPEKRYAAKNLRVARRELERCRALALPWLLFAKGVLR